MLGGQIDCVLKPEHRKGEVVYDSTLVDRVRFLGIKWPGEEQGGAFDGAHVDDLAIDINRQGNCKRCCVALTEIVVEGDGGVHFTVRELDFFAPTHWTTMPTALTPDASWFQYKGVLEWRLLSPDFCLRKQTKDILPADGHLTASIKSSQYTTMLTRWADNSPCDFNKLPSKLPQLPKCATMNAMKLLPPGSTVQLTFEPCGKFVVEEILKVEVIIEHHLCTITKEKRNFLMAKTNSKRYRLKKGVVLEVRRRASKEQSITSERQQVVEPA